MIMKKTGLVIAAAAIATILSGCATGTSCGVPDNSPMCGEPPAAANSCKGASSCKSACPTKKHKKHKKHHRSCTAENIQTHMTA